MATQELSKMGAAQVSIADFDGRSCILKQDCSAVELGFYQHASPQLAGVNTPRLLGVRGNDLYIERIPNSVALEELLANPSTFEQLAYIHNAEYRPDFPVTHHAWTQEANEAALATLNLPVMVEESFRSMQADSQELFAHQALISGDSNHGNWGRRDSGELVLFDWERFGFGSPAIDLAPLVSRLGSLTDYELITEQYTRHSVALPGELLVRHLILAKSWLVIEVTNLLVSRNKPDAPRYIDWYRENVPDWLGSVEGML